MIFLAFKPLESNNNNIFSKIMEKAVANRLTNYLESNNYLSPSQFGFRKNFSTSHALTKFLNILASANNSNLHTIALFCDLRKAFDTCDHEILLNKLYNLGINELTLTWFKNYLTNRHQYVEIDGQCSQLLKIIIGVPQGSVLGPLLFLIYINDHPEYSSLITILFADDTTLLWSHRDLDVLVRTFNAEFKKITNYFRLNKLSLHPGKTYCILFPANQNLSEQPIQIQIDFNDVVSTDRSYDISKVYKVAQVLPNSDIKFVRFLGILIDPKLTFKCHVDMLTQKISKALFFLRKMKNFLTTNALKSLYYSLIHSNLTYAIQVWSCTTSNILKNLISKQKVAIRLVSKAKYNAHTEPLFKKLLILPFEKIALMTKLQIMHQFLNNMLPEFTSRDWIRNEDRRWDPNQARLRNFNEIFIPFARTAITDRLPLTSFPRLWLNYDNNELKLIRSKVEFKIKLKKALLEELNDNYKCNRLFCPQCSNINLN